MPSTAPRRRALVALALLVLALPPALAHHGVDGEKGYAQMALGTHPYAGYRPLFECHGVAPLETGCTGTFPGQSSYYWVSSCGHEAKDCTPFTGELWIRTKGSYWGAGTIVCGFAAGVWLWCDGRVYTEGDITVTVEVRPLGAALPDVPDAPAPVGGWHVWFTPSSQG